MKPDVIRQNLDDIRQEKKPVSLAIQGMTDNVTDNVIDAKNSVKNNLTTDNVTDDAKKAFCEFCGSEFERRVSWKRFCCDECRKLNWEKNAGGKFLKKKIG